MQNLKFLEDQPQWRVAVVATFAKLLGVLIHVEGIPFGSNRTRKRQASQAMGEAGNTASGQTTGNAASKS